MFRYIVVLLLASSALAVPRLRLLSEEDIGRAFDANIDDADLSSYIVRLVELIIDLANREDAASQGTVSAQALGVMIKLADGIGGDNCYTAGMITAASTGATGAELRTALNRYINVTVAGIDHIVTLVENREAAKYSRGVAIGCARGGRDYDLERAWDHILANANNNNNDILNEEAAVVRDLYNSIYIRSNNVGAAATAAAVRPVVQVFQRALGSVAHFIRAIGGCDSYHDCLYSAASNAKAALLRSAEIWCRYN